MKKIGIGFLLFIVFVSLWIYFPMGTLASEPQVSTNKKDYDIGEEIIVSYQNVTDSLAGGQTLYVYLYKDDHIPGTHASIDYYTVYAGAVNRTPSGTFTFQTDGERPITSYPAGKYKILLLKGYTPVAEQIDITIGLPQISMNKDSYLVGEDIIVNYSKITAELDTQHGVDIRIYRVGDIPGTHPSMDYKYIKYAAQGISLPDSGTVNFPTEGDRNKDSYPPGEYLLTVYHAYTLLCDPIPFEITAQKPTISLNKNNFQPGDVIKVTYANVLKSYDQGQNLEIRIYKEGDVPGTHPSQDYVTIYDASKGVNLLESGTLSFPGDGARGKSDYGPGTYVVMLVHANTPIIEALTFTVTENPMTGDYPFLIMIFILSLGFIVIKRNVFVG